ncbi:MAG: hypothetical protein K0R63_1779 [Rickettsiales bacterium]|jgi:hypothetical protein|nr:hypothetical protein [Rickettsiales bacterium]
MPNPLKTLTEHQLQAASDSLEKAACFVEKFSAIHADIKLATETILHHIMEGDLSNHQLNSDLWHGLYNAAHRLNMFTDFTQQEVKKFHTVMSDLISLLSDARPPVPGKRE